MLAASICDFCLDLEDCCCNEAATGRIRANFSSFDSNHKVFFWQFRVPEVLRRLTGAIFWGSDCEFHLRFEGFSVVSLLRLVLVLLESFRGHSDLAFASAGFDATKTPFNSFLGFTMFSKLLLQL